jgi:mRNA-degrading endonuclease RelE of RelBE toxin-antitoxin system
MLPKIKDKKLHNTIADCIEKILEVSKLSEIPNCKKLKGSHNAYRIRIGDYRIGFVFEKRYVVFVRFLHRSKIYDKFPD